MAVSYSYIYRPLNGPAIVKATPVQGMCLIQFKNGSAYAVGGQLFGIPAPKLRDVEWAEKAIASLGGIVWYESDNDKLCIRVPHGAIKDAIAAYANWHIPEPVEKVTWDAFTTRVENNRDSSKRVYWVDNKAEKRTIIVKTPDKSEWDVTETRHSGQRVRELISRVRNTGEEE